MNLAALQPAVPSWSIITPDALYWKMWDDECVVFNATTGQTHVLEPVLALLIRQIEAGSTESEELVSQTAKLLGLELTDDVRDKLNLMLQKLAQYGLIESVSS